MKNFDFGSIERWIDWIDALKQIIESFRKYGFQERLFFLLKRLSWNMFYIVLVPSRQSLI